MFIVQEVLGIIMQFGLFYGFIALGYLIAKLSHRGQTINRYLTMLLVNLLIPLLFIYTFLTASLDSIQEIPSIIALILMVHLLGPALMFIYIRNWKSNLDDSAKGVFYICVTFNNALFIPLPIVMMFIGESGIPIVIIFSLIQMLLLATLGSFMGARFGSKAHQRLKIIKDALTFPPLLAAVLALILSISSIHLTSEIAFLLSFSGPMTTYLALLSVGIGIGVRFTRVDIRAAMEVVGIRQFMVPLISIPIILLSTISHLSSVIIILEALMPPAVLTAVYAAGFELDAERAATIVTVGTLLLLLVVPFIPLLLY